MKNFSFVNIKGGVGKTTLVYLTAQLLQHFKNMKVLIVDIDPQANITAKMLENETLKLLDSQNTVYGLLSQSIKDINIDKFILPSIFKNIDIVPSSIQLSLLEHKLPAELNGMLKLSMSLKQVQSRYDVCLIDCPPSLGSFTISATMASDYVIAPLEPSNSALQGTGVLLSMLEELLIARQELRFLGFVLNKVDMRYSHHKAFVQLVKQQFSNNLLNTIIGQRASIQRLIDAKQQISLLNREDSSTFAELKEYIKEFQKRASI